MNRLACAIVLAGTAGVCALFAPVAHAKGPSARAGQGVQLSLITPDPNSIGDRLSVDVSYRGGTVESVELYLDGALVANRKLMGSQTRGVLSFSVDAILLAEGSHNLLLKAVTSDGKTIQTSGKVMIPAIDLNAPVRISYPANGLQVSGIVPIRVHMDSQMLRQKPYVTFFVDKDFQVLRNYPPYEYIWDTTKTNNGWHRVEAWTQTADSTAVLKARPVNVSVNNSAGNTRKKDKIEDLRGEVGINVPVAVPTVPTKTFRTVDPTTAATGIPTLNPTVAGRTPSALAGPARPSANGDPLRAVEPGAFGYGAITNPVSRPGMVTKGDRRMMGAGMAKMMGGAVLQPHSGTGLTSRPTVGLPSIPKADLITSVISPSNGGAGLVTVQPGDTLTSVSERTGIKTQDLAKLNNIRRSARLRPGTSLIVPNAGYFDVAFDGTQIAFDVRPRVENGMQLAPFRQIFEHSGGRLYWFGGEAQTVRAVNSTKEIQIRIGEPDALVNNKTISLDRSAYLVKGRTIVPLTFIRDAMDVKVNFDAKSGKLMIQSNR